MLSSFETKDWLPALCLRLHRRLAVTDAAERTKRRQEFDHECGPAMQQLDATARQLEHELAERQRQLASVQTKLHDLRQRDNALSQRHVSEGRQAKNELARTRDPEMLRELERLGTDLGYLQEEQRRNFAYLKKYRAAGDANKAATLQYRAEECRATGRAVPEEITRDQAAIKARPSGVADVERRMQERQQRMDQIEARVN